MQQRTGMTDSELREFLELKTAQYNTVSFINDDPVSIPHLFSEARDQEIAGFLAATIAWGQRPVIIRNANSLMRLMDMSPFDFVMNASTKDLKRLTSFVHRTFNGKDAVTFVLALRNIYQTSGSLEASFIDRNAVDSMSMISIFRNNFFSIKHPPRTEKHVSDPSRNSSAKRLNMFLRWMVRKDSCGVDLGIWKKIKPSQLCIPLDVHVGNTARALGLLERKQDDAKAVIELTNRLRSFDAIDPVKYDYALFGLGIYEHFGTK